MNRLFKKPLSVILLIFMLLALAGCSDSSPASSQVPTSPSTTQSTKAQETPSTTQQASPSTSQPATVTPNQNQSSSTPEAKTQPSNTPAKVQQATPNTEKQTVTVYITKTGKKYHRDGCRYLSKSRIPISLSDAKSEGYGPCSVCNPPQ